jgi:hypothetical protein
MFGFGSASGGPLDERQRRRRRWFITGISVGAAILVIALCAGALAVVDAVNGVQDRASDAREVRQLRDDNCLDLERRLNKLVPPGATSGTAARAAAIRNENAAVRIYVGEVRAADAQDDWRQLLDARSVYADALDRQAKSNTPAFYVAPRNDDGEAVAVDLENSSQDACAGSIRRLATPDL